MKWPEALILRWLPALTVRDPEADRYQLEAQHRLETARARATKEKNTRDPATNGAQVETITSEPLGRLGKEGVQVVEAMAADAAMMRGDRSVAPAAGRRRTRWHQQQEAVGCRPGNEKRIKGLEGSSGKEEELDGSADEELTGASARLLAAPPQAAPLPPPPLPPPPPPVGGA